MIPSPDIAIHQATIADAEAIIAGINTVCAEGCYFSTPQYIPTPQWETVLYAPETVPDHLLYVVEDRGKIVGAAQILPCTPQSHVGELGVFLLKPYRNQKIGTYLLTELLQSARLYYDRVILYVLATNHRAIRCFTKCGFEEILRRSHNYAHLGWQEQLIMHVQ